MAMRALIPREGSAPVRDRLLMTLFIAALIHGMLILGLTFAGGGSRDNSARGLDVLLTSDELPTAQSNPNAAYLAQRTQLGSGNTSAPVVAHNEASPASPPIHTGVAEGKSLTSSAPAASEADDPVVSTVAQRTDIRYFSAVQGDTGVTQEQPLAVDLVAPPRPTDGDTGAVQLRGPQRTQLWITPDTRESIVAPYLDNWRRRVERIGTLNYPTAAKRAGVQASPVLEVSIAADGHLAKAEILTTSGYPDLDAAALAILKLASPFDPFPPDLAARYQSLSFAYEWQFSGGRVARGPLSVVP
jgi:periplasmic protein TonB